MKKFEKVEIEIIRFSEDNIVVASCMGPGTGTNCECVGCYGFVGCVDVGCQPDNYGMSNT